MIIPNADASRTPDSSAYEAIEERARTWWIWLRSGEATLADGHAFRHWRAQSVEHARAVGELAQAWGALAALADLPELQGAARKISLDREAPRAAGRRTSRDESIRIDSLSMLALHVARRGRSR